ncbi:hypothetical protein NKJ59_31360 [Mesorhizobium australicum]|uniref:hypothetical protein n=1 Tax=Mesorhizobium australicum TaxID=536018 RepID=UPI0033362D74
MNFAIAPNKAFAVIGRAVILDAADVGWLSHRYELIHVGYADVMRMGCNVTALGNDVVLSAKQLPEINVRIRANGLEGWSRISNSSCSKAARHTV